MPQIIPIKDLKNTSEISVNSKFNFRFAKVTSV